MATLYKVMGSGDWNAVSWSTISSASAATNTPTAADDCICEATSGNVTINLGSVCRSWDCQGGTGNYTGTATHSAAVTLTIGDATAGLGNRALRLSSGMNYTLRSVTTSAIRFVSTSATQQTVALSGRTVGPLEFNATSNGSWSHSDAINIGASTLLVFKGTWTSNSQTITAGKIDWSGTQTKSLTFGTTTATLSGLSPIAANTTGTTLSAAASTINCTNGAIVAGGGSTFGTVNFTACSQSTITGANTFAVLTATGTAAKADTLTLSANQTVTDTLTLAGNSAINRILVQSDTLGTARTITNSGATMTWSNVDFRDIALGTAYDANAITGKSGDCGGCSNITFTTAAAQVWFGTSGGNWSTNSWSGRVPLPQDDVTINQAFSAGQTITADMPRLGKSITFANTGNSVAWAKTTATTMYGSLTMTGTSLMTNSGTTAFTFEGRGAHTLTSAGQTFTNPIVIAMVGGSLTHQDAWTGSSVVTHNNGTHSLNDFNATVLRYSSTSVFSRVLTVGSGVLSCTGTGTAFNISSTALTVTATTGTLAITDTSSSLKQVETGSKTLGLLSITTGGTGAVQLTGIGTFTRLVCPGGSTKSIIFPGSTTTTFTGANPFPSGAAGNLLTFTPSSGSATIAATEQISADFLNLTNIVKSGATAYAGVNSVNGGGNTNWAFTAPPAAGGPFPFHRRAALAGGFAEMSL